MGILDDVLPHDVTYWAVTGDDGFGGFTFASPVLIKGRWEDRNQTSVGEAGRTQLSRSTVFLNQDVAEHDYLYLGDATANPIPTDVDGAFPIMEFQKISDLGNADYVRKALL